MNVGVCLAGSGVFDGSEIHETVCTLLALDRLNATVRFYSLSESQAHVINHHDQTELQESRSCLVESARLARGPVEDFESFNSKDVDALLFPGGFGVAKNFCDFAFKGTEMTIKEPVKNAILSMHQSKKPLAFMCISSVLAARLIPGAIVTVGSKSDASQAIESWGAVHQESTVEQVVIDEANNIFSTPAYMCEASISNIEKGISILVEKVLSRTLVSSR